MLIFVVIPVLSSTLTIQAGAPELSQLLAYRATGPRNLTVIRTQEKPGVIIEDIKFDAIAKNKQGQAYRVYPKTSQGLCAGILFVHWYEPNSPLSNRTQFLEEAEGLARRGVVSLLVSTMWSDPSWFISRKSAEDYPNSLQQTIELRHALDILLAQPNVDPKRIGYVGHDFGAVFGATLAGVDNRPKTFVFIAGVGRYFDWYKLGAADGIPTGKVLNKYLSDFVPLDPVNALKSAKASVLFQFGEDDFYTPRDNFIEFYQAAPNPKRINTYLSMHEMNAWIIKTDRDAWLGDQLELQ